MPATKLGLTDGWEVGNGHSRKNMGYCPAASRAVRWQTVFFTCTKDTKTHITRDGGDSQSRRQKPHYYSCNYQNYSLSVPDKHVRIWLFSGLLLRDTYGVFPDE